jgi:hypothetical protein
MINLGIEVDVLMTIQFIGLITVVAKMVIDGNARKRDHEWAVKEAGMQKAKIEQIHTLVNSNMTAAMENELEARRSNLILLEEAAQAKRMLGAEPSPEVLASIAATRIKISELSSQLNDRAKQTDSAAQQLKSDMAQLKGGGISGSGGS